MNVLTPPRLSKNATRSSISAFGLVEKDIDVFKALEDEKIAGVGLDVYDKEPLQQDHKLRFLANALLLPHIGYVTAENYAKFYPQMMENLNACVEEKPIRTL